MTNLQFVDAGTFRAAVAAHEMATGCAASAQADTYTGQIQWIVNGRIVGMSDADGAFFRVENL